MHLMAALSWFLDPSHWLTILTVAAGLGFVIFVHELGHFLVAKACGVKCEKFYIGFDIGGWKIVHFQWGETEYGIGILPLGGYVKMLGQDDNPARIADETRRSKLQSDSEAPQAAGSSDASVATTEHAPALTHGDLPPEPVSDPHVPYDPRSYMAQSVPKRMAIISAGVIMNVIFAFIMATVAYLMGVRELPCTVGEVMAGGAAWKADLRPGDQILRIGNLENPRFRDLQTNVPLSDVEKGIELDIKRPGVEQSFTVKLFPDDKSLGIARLGVGNYLKTRLDEKFPVIPQSAAANAKPEFMGGDRIAHVAEEAIGSYADLLSQLALKVDETLHVTVLRPAAETLKSRPEGDGSEQWEAEREKQLDDSSSSLAIEVPSAQVRDVGLVLTAGPIVGVQKGSPAEDAGVLAGDILLEIDGQPVGNPMTLPERMRAVAKQGRKVNLLIERNENGGKKKVSLELKPRVSLWYYPSALEVDPIVVPSVGIAYKVLNEVRGVIPGSPAEAAGIKAGDVVTSFQLLAPADQPAPKSDDESVVVTDSKVIPFDDRTPAWPNLILEVLPTFPPQGKLKLWLESGGKQRTVELTPAAATLEDGTPWHVPQRGFHFQPVSYIQTASSLSDALRLGREETVDDLLMVYRFLQRIGQQKISLKMTAGPIGMAEMAAMKVKEGFTSFLLFLTVISANLAVINFLPIPLLDGGHMVFLAYELIRGKPASERVIVAFTYAGLMFILSLMLFVLALDTGLISRR